jgi:hypothetical protein
VNYKKKLINIIDHVRIEEEEFINNLTDKNEAFLSNYNNWSFKDVVSHISEWRILSSQKLQSVKNSQYVLFHEELDAINRKNYEKHKNESIEQIKLLSKNSYSQLKDKVNLYDNLELIGESNIDGFKFTLLQYILIDALQHPTIHMVFHYIKIQRFEKAFKMLQNNYLLLLELNNSFEAIVDFFYLGQVS